MLILIVSLIVLAVVAAVAGVIRNRRLRKQVESGELEAMPETVQVDSECCGQHEVCEKESLLADAGRRRSRMGTQPAAPRDCSAGQPEGRGLSRCRRTESQSA